MNHTPLVSVGIITYNSSKYVLDALESVKAQTYKNIELIVSDDCSTDNTVKICQNWIEENRSRFVNSTLITVEKNTGTSGNLNRLLGKCRSEWFKVLAGDDALYPDCIEKFVLYVNNNTNVKFVVGKLKTYKYTFEEKNFVFESTLDDILDRSAEEQLKKMVHGNTFIPPTIFYNIDIARKLGGYDEKYGIIEDFPFYLKVLKAGYKFYKMDEFVLKYRSSDTNVYGRMDILFNYRHRYYDYLIRKDLCFQFYTFHEKIRTHTDFVIFWIMNKLDMTKKTRLNRGIFNALKLIFAIITFDASTILHYLKKIKQKTLASG